MIVLDASAALVGLLNRSGTRDLLATERLHAPHLIDSEIASGLRRQVQHGRLDPSDGWTALDTWRRLAVSRYPLHGLFERIWELRENLSAYDAGYVALAETLGCTLVTADARLSNSARNRSPITVVSA